jgi:hypothetical protein
MGLFRQLIDTLPVYSGNALGDVVRIPLQRDYPREGLIIRLTGVATGSSATAPTLGAYELIKRIRLLVNDGGVQRSLCDVWGPALVIRQLHNNQSLPIGENATLSTGTPNIAVTFPLFFPPSVLNSPTREMFLQNFPRFNSDPQLEITLANQADVDLNATPTFAASAGFTLSVLDIKREVSVPNWNFLQTEILTSEKAYPADVTNDRYQLPVPGYHYYCGVVSFASRGVLGDITDGNPIRLDVLNTSLRSVSLANLARLNAIGNTTQQTALAALAANIGFFDFLTDQTGSDVVNLDTLLNTNPFTQLGTGPVLNYSVSESGASAKLLFIHERCFGDISGALALRKLGK